MILDELTYQVSPHEIAAYQGTVALYKHIFEQTKTVNPVIGTYTTVSWAQNE